MKKCSCFVSSILLLLVLGVVVVSSSKVPNDDEINASSIVNNDVHTFIDLSNPSVVRSIVNIKFTRTEQQEKTSSSSSSSSYYYLAFPSDIADTSIASLAVYIKDGSNNVSLLPVEKANSKKKNGVQYYKVDLSSSSSSSLIVKTAFTPDILKPFPTHVEQTPKTSKTASTQYLIYNGYAYFWTPYLTKTQTSHIRLPKSVTESFTNTPSPVEKSGSSITYGPYKDIESPFVNGVHSTSKTTGAIKIHYECNAAVLSVKSFQRLAEVSHWGGNLNIEDHYELHHVGAKLKGFYSNIDFRLYQSSHSQTNVVKELKLKLPRLAKDVYYKDTIGNVSTSHFRNEKKRSLLEVKPRYPLYGGWRYTFFYGFNVPLGDFLMGESSDEYKLSIPFFESLENVTIQEASIQIRLPEGAEVVDISYPPKADSQRVERQFTYLDTIGRSTVLLTRANAVDEVAGPIEITYYYPQHYLAIKPLAVALAIFSMFVGFMVVSRLDFSIVPKQRSSSSSSSSKKGIKKQVEVLEKKVNQQFEEYKLSFENLKGVKPAVSIQGFEKSQKEFEESILDTITLFEKIAKQLSSSGGDGEKGFKQVVLLLKEKFGKVKSMQKEVISKNSSSSSGGDDKGKSKVGGGTSSNNSVKEIEALDEKIEQAFLLVYTTFK